MAVRWRLVLVVASLFCVTNVGAGAALQPSDDGWTYVEHEPMPGSYDELPMGEPTTVPWLQQGRLHIAGTSIRTGGKTVLVGGAGTYVLGRGQGSPQHTKGWWLLVDDHLERLPSKGTTRLPFVSGNGRWIAWIDTWRTPIDQTDEDPINRVKQRVVVYDATKRRIATLRHETRRSEGGDASNELWLHGLNNRGQALIMWGEAGDHVLSRFQQRGYLAKLKVNGMWSSEQQSYPGGVMLTDYTRARSWGVYGRAAEMGRFTEVGRIPDPTGEWSLTGGYFLHESWDELGSRFIAYRTADDHALELGVPAVDEYVGLVGWETETTVILWRTSNTYDDEPDVSFLVRCDVLTTDCERVPNGPTPGGRVDFP